MTPTSDKRLVDEVILNELWLQKDYEGMLNHLDPFIQMMSKVYFDRKSVLMTQEDHAQLARLRLWTAFNSGLYDDREQIWPLCAKIVKISCYRIDPKMDYFTLSLSTPIREDFTGGNSMADFLLDDFDIEQPHYLHDLLYVLREALNLELSPNERGIALELIGMVESDLTMGEAVRLCSRRMDMHYRSLMNKIRTSNNITADSMELSDEEIYEILHKHFNLGQRLRGIGLLKGYHIMSLSAIVSGKKYRHVFDQFNLDYPPETRLNKFNRRGKRLKVSHEQALEILRSDKSRMKLADEYEVSRATIDNILSGRDHREAYCLHHGLEYVPKPFKPNRVVRRVKKGIGKGRWTKLSDQQLKEIVDLLDEGKITKADIARRYNIWPQTIQHIHNGKTKPKLLSEYRASRERPIP